MSLVGLPGEDPDADTHAHLNSRSQVERREITPQNTVRGGGTERDEKGQECPIPGPAPREA